MSSDPIVPATSEPTTPEPMIVETADRVFAHTAAGDGGASDWATIAAAGLDRAWVAGTLGGGGASLVDGLAVARACGRHAVALPVAETLLASWTLARAGVAAPAGPLTLALTPAGVPGDATPTGVPGDDSPTLDGGGVLRGVVRRVAFAVDVPHAVLMARGDGGWKVALVALAGVARTAVAGLSGEARDVVTLDGVRALATAPAGNALDPDALLRVAALVRACQMAGALERVLEISLDYARQREQFGRPISRFQAVQQELARLAGECAAASIAADAGAVALARFGIHDERAARACAVAKIRVGEAAGVAAAIAHQVHGAMGFSEEYQLQRYTRRLWTWRDDFGAEAHWAGWLGRRVARAGAAALWPDLTAG